MLCCCAIFLYFIFILSFLTIFPCKGAFMDTTIAEIIHRQDKEPLVSDSNVPIDNGSASLGFTSLLVFNNDTVISHILPELSTSLESLMWPLTAESVPGRNNYEKDTFGNLITVDNRDLIEESTNIPNATAELVLTTANYGDELGKQESFTVNGINQKLPPTQYPTDIQYSTRDKITPSPSPSIAILTTPSKQGNNITTMLGIKVNATKLQKNVINTTYPYTPLHITTAAITTEKHIYVRGHKIYNPRKHKNKKSKSNIKTVSGYPLHHNKQNLSKAGRQKRKHKDGSKSEPEEAFISISQNTGYQRSFAKTYAWHIGAAMLVIGSLLILLGSILLCYCGEKLNKHREDRHRSEKYGNYERVESVSSLVSSHGPNHDCYDDNLETVSMI